MIQIQLNTQATASEEKIPQIHTEGCLVCGKELIYSETVQMHTCAYCKKEYASQIYCPEGHFVCDDCHRSDAGKIIEVILESTKETNPLTIAREIMATPHFQMHGPEHHLLVPLVLLAALRNLGVNIEKNQFRNALIRGKQLPGGICGSWGACGAALGAGIALSVVRRLTSLSKEDWGRTNRDTGVVLQKVGEYGGPRCCKRSVYSALLAAVDILERDGVVQFPREAHEKPICKDFWRNKQCLKAECPYYPKPKNQNSQSG